MSEAEYNEQNRRIEAEQNQRNAEEFWAIYTDGKDDGVDGDGTPADESISECSTEVDAIQHQFDVLEYQNRDTETPIETLRKLAQRFSRTFGNGQPFPPCCCNHCIN